MFRQARGFTLIEMMVVVVIIVVLLALMLPAMTRAREQSKTMMCAASMRELGHLIVDFAAGHDGRGPGRAAYGTAYDVRTPYPEDAGSVDWADILNNDLLQIGDGTQLVYGKKELSLTTGFTIGSHTLRCPNFIELANAFGGRPFGYNYDAAGGLYYTYNGVEYGPWWGLYGKQMNPQAMGSTFYTSYALGAKLARFGPSQFLLVENERRNDWSVEAPATGNGSVVLGGTPGIQGDPMNPTIPDWSACSGQFSFRHPYYKKANFMCFDGHVEMLTPSDDVNSRRRLSIQQY